MEYMPFPTIQELGGKDAFETLEQAMDAYGRYARDNGFPYLLAWRPWQRTAKSFRRLYPQPAEAMLEDDGSTNNS